MKYIDADLLRKEIEHRIDILGEVSVKQQKKGDSEMSTYYHGKAIALEELLSFLDTLQEPEFPATDEEMEAFLASHPKVEVPEKYKTPDWLFKELEQEPEVDLEKAAVNAYESWKGGTMDDFMRDMEALGKIVKPLRNAK